jgi:hypothetical protein
MNFMDNLKSRVEWNGMEWNGMEWNGMEWNGKESKAMQNKEMKNLRDNSVYSVWYSSEIF